MVMSPKTAALAPDRHIVADRRVPLLLGRRNTAERHALENRNVILNNRRLADHHAGGMIDEKAFADRGTR